LGKQEGECSFSRRWGIQEIISITWFHIVAIQSWLTRGGLGDSSFERLLTRLYRRMILPRYPISENGLGQRYPRRNSVHFLKPRMDFQAPWSLSKKSILFSTPRGGRFSRARALRENAGNPRSPVTARRFSLREISPGPIISPSSERSKKIDSEGCPLSACLLGRV